MSKILSAKIANSGFHFSQRGEGPLSFQMEFRLPDNSVVSSNRFVVGHNVDNGEANGSFSTQPARLIEALMSIYELTRYNDLRDKDAVLVLGEGGKVDGLCNPHGSDAWVDFQRIAALANADAHQLVSRVSPKSLNRLNGNPGLKVERARITSADFYFTPLFLFELQAKLENSGELVTTGPISVGAPHLPGQLRVAGPRSTMVARLLHNLLSVLEPQDIWENLSYTNPGIAVELSADDPTQIIRIGKWNWSRWSHWCNLGVQIHEAELEHHVLCEFEAA
jgi:hypothetical protein